MCYSKLTQWLCHLWEVPDQHTSRQIDVIIGMCMPHGENGGRSKLLSSLVQGLVNVSRKHPDALVIIMNRWLAGPNGRETCLANVARDELIELGVPREKIRVPKDPSNSWWLWVRNTRAELQYALRTAGAWYEYRRIRAHIVANHLHMRRVLGAARILPEIVMADLSWRSNYGWEAYGTDSSQARFRHPLRFLVMELASYAYSKLVRWA